MKEQLTPEEQVELYRVLTASKWDVLSNWLALLAPCVLVGAVGIWNDSISVVACGGLTFVLVALCSVPREMRRFIHLRSALQKLKEHADAAE